MTAVEAFFWLLIAAFTAIGIVTVAVAALGAVGLWAYERHQRDGWTDREIADLNPERTR